MFMILSLPRSRSAWLAHYLNYSPRRVGHDIALNCDSIDEFLGCYRRGMWGTVETGAVVAWRLIRHELPGLKLVVVRRPLVEVVRSLEAKGVEPRLDELAGRAAMLDELAAQPEVHQLDWLALDNVDCCGWLFEHCLELPFDPEWYAKCSILNIQIDLPARMKQLVERQAAMTGLQREVEERTRELRRGMN